eukprot:scpid43474/ scgid29046/ Myotubularin-related protein 2
MSSGKAKQTSPLAKTSSGEKPTTEPCGRLLVGETIEETAPNVVFLCPFNGPLAGTLFVTTYKIMFVSSEGEPRAVYVAPLGAIHSVEKVGGASSRGEHSYGLEMQFKDIRTFRMAFRQEGRTRRTIYDLLQKLAFPLSSGGQIFAFNHYSKGSLTKHDAEHGWGIFSMIKELRRIGVPNEGWRLSSINEEYQFCPTYPAVLTVPAAVTDVQLEAVASFRSRARIPVLSWLHPENHSSLTRGSQPLVGKLGKHSRDDEAYLEEISKSNPNSQKLVIMDARPKLNAIANKAMGGGYEDEEHYTHMELLFLDIGNIHVMRESLRKLREMCFPTIDDAHWMSNLENTHWLDHVKLVLAAANRVVDLMDRCRVSVVVHCSDGWDRTSQVCSLAMMLMDPYYRTIRGFAVLVEKEWLAFGHKFQQRVGQGDKHCADEQRAPIFVQFIDAVWQVTRQFPCAFEFNEAFLLAILDHLYSCLFGTFLCNTERERKAVKDATKSLWAFIAEHRDEFVNPLFSEYLHNHVLCPIVSIRRLQLWVAYYARWNPRMRPQENERDRTTELYKLCQRLQSQCAEMEQKLK